MAARGVVTLDGSQYQKKLEELKAQTGRAAGDMSKSVNNFGRSVGSAGKAVGLLASDVGSKFGAIGNTIGALASGPIAALVAALGAVIAIGREVWDSLTLSADEYMTKLEHTSKMQEKQLAAMEKEQSAEQGYMDRLKELTKKENLSNTEKDEAVFLINTLTSKYGELGIELDTTTGKIKGLIEAEKELNEKQRQAKIASLEERIKTEMNISNAGFRNQSESGFFGWINQASDWISGNKSAADVYAGRSLESRMEYANSRLRMKGIAKEELDYWTKEIDRLQKIKDMTDELNNLREYGQETVEKHAAAMKEASETETKTIEEQTKAEENLWEAAQKATEEFQEQLRASRELAKSERNRKEQYLVGQVMPLRDAALRASGQGKQAALDSAVWAATQAKGSALSDDEYSQIVEMETANYELNHAMKNLVSGIDFAPRVNSLIARGGSEAPVAMPKVEDLQAKTLSSVDKISRITTQILSSIDDWITI